MAIAAPARADESLRLEYAGSILGFRVMRADVAAQFTGARYEGETLFRSAGIVGFFKTSKVEAKVSGLDGGRTLTPTAYEHVETIGKKVRNVDLDYRADDVMVTANPRISSLGEPPTTPALRREALDPVSAILAIAAKGGAYPCDRTVPVFDSKLRYDLRMEFAGVEDVRTRGFKGAAVHCRIFYTPIAGFDPEDLADPQVYATPIHVWLGEVAPGVQAPVRVQVRVAGRIPIDARVDLTGYEAG